MTTDGQNWVTKLYSRGYTPCDRHLVAEPFGWAAVVQKVDPDSNTVDGFVWPIVGPHPALLNQLFTPWPRVQGKWGGITRSLVVRLGKDWITSKFMQSLELITLILGRRIKKLYDQACTLLKRARPMYCHWWVIMVRMKTGYRCVHGVWEDCAA